MEHMSNLAIDNFRERYWVRFAKMSADLVALQASLLLGWYLRSFLARWWPLEISGQTRWDLAVGMLLVPCGYWLVRLYPGYGLTSVERLRRRIRATFVFFMAFATWDFLLVHASRSRGVILFSFLFALILPPIAQWGLRIALTKLNLWGMPVVVLGAGKTGEQVVTTLVRDSVLGLRPVAVLDDDPDKWGTRIEGVPVTCGIDRAREFAGKVNSALIAIPGAGREKVVELARNLPFFTVVIVPDLIGLQSLWVEARDMGGIIGLELQKNLLLRRNRFIKRLMDYALGIPLFILSFPIISIFTLWTMAVSPGNPFYCQVREGKGGRKFKVWKLRTMHLNAEKLLHDYLKSNPAAKQEWQQFFKLKSDPRILPGVGHILRKTSLDELPQLWNVLCGEMSLVGPRPFPHYHLEQFNEDFREIRRSVMPGMTGLWQVTARSDGDLRVQEALDTYYIRNWSLWLDISLLGRTFLVVFGGKGAY